MQLVHYDRVLRRVYICRARVHHGLVGVGLIGAGVVLIARDWHDRWWLHD